MYRYEDLREVHVELTTRCNASCPQCPRNISGGPVNPTLPLAELSLSDVRSIFPQELLAQLRKIYACGNYGDPMVAQDTLPIFEYFREANPKLDLGMFTNGSGRTADFWKQLAKSVNYVRFSIDGLEDTNHLYRRGTRWSHIMNSVAAFVGAGGRAEWDFIVFRHNEHQVEKARVLATQLGFRKFFVKKTSRFFSAGRIKDTEVQSRSGQKLYVLQEPVEPAFRNEATQHIADVGAFSEYQSQTEIACKAASYKRIYVSAEGLVLPCCWLGALYPPGRPLGSTQAWGLIEQLPLGRTSLDGRGGSLQSIVESAFFQSHVPAGWEKKSVTSGRLEPCVRACGAVDTHAAQYGASQL
jgi:MoaA/NifB/PqqE/SkfB family radical SAM enzyme